MMTRGWPAASGCRRRRFGAAWTTAWTATFRDTLKYLFLLFDLSLEPQDRQSFFCCDERSVHRLNSTRGAVDGGPACHCQPHYCRRRALLPDALWKGERRLRGAHACRRRRGPFEARARRRRRPRGRRDAAPTPAPTQVPVVLGREPVTGASRRTPRAPPSPLVDCRVLPMERARRRRSIPHAGVRI